MTLFHGSLDRAHAVVVTNDVRAETRRLAEGRRLASRDYEHNLETSGTMTHRSMIALMFRRLAGIQRA